MTSNGLRYLSGAPAISGVLAKNLLSGQVASQQNRFIGDANFYKGDSTPAGYSPTTGAWYPNRKIGGISSHHTVIGIGSVSNALLAGGINAAVNMIGSGTIVTRPYLQRAICLAGSIVALGEIQSASMAGFMDFPPTTVTGQGNITDVLLNILDNYTITLEGEGSISAATLVAPVLFTANIDGAGDLNGSLVGMIQLLISLEGEGYLTPNIKFPANLTSAQSGSGSITTALLRGIADCLADIIGDGNVTGTIYSKGFMEATISAQGEVLTKQAIAAEVWRSILANYQEDGSTGKALSSAGSAGDPWTGIMENYTDDATFGAFIKKLLTTNEFFGLR